MDQSKIRQWIERIPHHIKEVIRCEGGNEYKEGRPSWMKSREVNRMIEKVFEGEEDLDESEGELIDSNLWVDSGLYSEDEELERELIWVDEGELYVPLRKPEPEPESERPVPAPVRAAARQGVRQPAIAVERPLRRSNRKKD
jgi:hypothetical protein